jgi:hypothetical protein
MRLYEFLEHLLATTESAPVISLSVGQNGEVNGLELEWYKGPRRIVSVLIGRDETVAWGCLLGDASFSGEFVVDEWKDARPAVAALKKWEAA